MKQHCWVLAIVLFSQAQEARAAAFTEAFIGQSTPLAGASNLITVTLVSDTSFASNSGITISGLETASSGSGSIVKLIGNSVDIFGSVAAWSDTGALTCTLAAGKSMQAGTRVIFSFVLVNPSGAQQAQTIVIRASGSAAQNMVSYGGDVEGVQGGREPLLTIVPEFTTAFITQTTPLTTVVNYIIIFLQANCILTRGSRISIAGLNATNVADESVCFQLELFPHGQLFGPNGCVKWTQGPGLLELTVQTNLRSSDVYQIVLPLRNPSFEQPSPRVIIYGDIESSISAAQASVGYRRALLQWREMEKDDTPCFGVPKGANILLITRNQMTLKGIQQSLPLANADNTITISLVSMTEMPSGSKITISGLHGSSTSTSSQLPILSNNYLLPTAQWNQPQGQVVFQATYTGIPSNFLTVIRFVLKNENRENEGGLIWLDGYVETSSGLIFDPKSASPLWPGEVEVDNTAVLGILNGSHPLTYLKWYRVKNISQSTAQVDALNTLTVTLELNILLPSLSQLTLTGLLVSQTPSNVTLPLTYPASASNQVFGPWAQ
jgi:hypothetical protein